MCVLCFVNNEDTMQTSYTINRTKRVEHELLIAFHVTRIDFNKEIVVTTGVITLCYFLKILHNVHKLLYEFLRVLFQSDIT